MIEVSRPYRIGWWTHRWWPRAVMVRGAITGRQPDGQRAPRRFYLREIVRNLRLLRPPHRPWQAEADGQRFARRAFTADGAWTRMAVDVAYQAHHGRPSPHQRRRWSSRRSRRVIARISRDSS